jgi:predicted outer membrane protein
MNNGKFAPIGLALLVAVGAACDNDDHNATATSKSVQFLTDAQSAAVLHSLNVGEIGAANVTQPKAARQTVQEFAGKMITEHSQADATATVLLQQAWITPEPVALSLALDASANQLSTQLVGLTGPALDAAYMNSQVEMHRTALTLIDCAILPSLQNVALRNFVQNTVRPAVQMHLDLATQIVGTLPGATATPVATAPGSSTPAIAPPNLTPAGSTTPGTIPPGYMRMAVGTPDQAAPPVTLSSATTPVAANTLCTDACVAVSPGAAAASVSGTTVSSSGTTGSTSGTPYRITTGSTGITSGSTGSTSSSYGGTGGTYGGTAGTTGPSTGTTGSSTGTASASNTSPSAVALPMDIATAICR